MSVPATPTPPQLTVNSPPPAPWTPRSRAIFSKWKKALVKLRAIGSFVSEDQPLVVIPYPLLSDGSLVCAVGAHLEAYQATHEWELPNCFCGLLNAAGQNQKAHLVVPKGGDHRNNACLACATFSCSYFLDLATLTTHNPGLLTSTYPELMLHDDLDDANSWPASTTLSQTSQPLAQDAEDVVNTPVFTSPQNPLPSLRSLIKNGSQSLVFPPPPPIANPSYVLFNTPSPAHSNGGSNRDADDFFLGGGLPLGLFSSPTRAALAENGIMPKTDDDFFVTDLQTRFESEVPDDMVGLRVKEANPLSVQESRLLLLDLLTGDGVGLRFQDFIRLFRKCFHCSRIMTPSQLRLHRCQPKAVPPSSSSTAAPATNPSPIAGPSTLSASTTPIVRHDTKKRMINIKSGKRTVQKVVANKYGKETVGKGKGISKGKGSLKEKKKVVYHEGDIIDLTKDEEWVYR